MTCNIAWVDENFVRNLAKHNGAGNFFNEYLRNMYQHNVQHCVLPLRLTSQIAACVLYNKGIRADMIYVDASHDYMDVLTDMTLPCPAHSTWPLFW